ncbi:MAG: hypothetical protein PCFJNLEI_02605 [Verrucomicrobiae bacterium]|nr:hypothetical protein [Verrucomicrobiae bacterium]
MLEVSTRAMEKSLFLRMLATAKERPEFRRVGGKGNILQMTAFPLPDFTGYQILPFPGFQITHVSSEYSHAWLEQFFLLLDEFTDTGAICCAQLSIGESGKAYDPKQQTDLSLNFGKNFIGPKIDLQVGPISPGEANHAYRKQLFDTFLRIVGMVNRIAIVTVGNELELEIRDRKILDLEKIKRDRIAVEYRQGARFVAKGCTNSVGRDFRELRLNTFDHSELIAVVPKLIAHYGAAVIHRAEVSVSCKPGEYSKTREILNQSTFHPLTVRVAAVARYGLDNIEQAIAENDQFLISGFQLKDKTIGEIDVDLALDSGKYTLNASGKFKKDVNEQRVALERLLCELAGGEDVIDRTLI